MRAPFSLVFVADDGSPVVWLRISRWIAYGILAGAVALGATAVRLSEEYVRRAREAGEIGASAGDRSEVGRALEARLASIRGEVTAWTALHARMSAALGRPETRVPTVPGSAVGRSPSEELDILAATVADEGTRVRDLEQAISHAGKLVAKLPLRWPVRGSVNSEYGRRRSPWTGKPAPHEGIDIGTSPGTPIASPAAGRVVSASLRGSYGKNVVLDHGNGVRSRYAHLQELDVGRGDRVEKGQLIGLVGRTGRSTGPHLHYEVLVQGKPVNPRQFLLE